MNAGPVEACDPCGSLSTGFFGPANGLPRNCWMSKGLEMIP